MVGHLILDQGIDVRIVSGEPIMKPDDVAKMSLKEIEALEKRIWDLPKVTHGQAQVPYFMDRNTMDLLNACIKRRQELGL